MANKPIQQSTKQVLRAYCSKILYYALTLEISQASVSRSNWTVYHFFLSSDHGKVNKISEQKVPSQKKMRRDSNLSWKTKNQYVIFEHFQKSPWYIFLKKYIVNYELQCKEGKIMKYIPEIVQCLCKERNWIEKKVVNRRAFVFICTAIFSSE